MANLITYKDPLTSNIFVKERFYVPRQCYWIRNHMPQTSLTYNTIENNEYINIHKINVLTGYIIYMALSDITMFAPKVVITNRFCLLILVVTNTSTYQVI